MSDIIIVNKARTWVSLLIPEEDERPSHGFTSKDLIRLNLDVCKS